MYDTLIYFLSTNRESINFNLGTYGFTLLALVILSGIYWAIFMKKKNKDEILKVISKSTKCLSVILILAILFFLLLNTIVP